MSNTWHIDWPVNGSSHCHHSPIPAIGGWALKTRIILDSKKYFNFRLISKHTTVGPAEKNILCKKIIIILTIQQVLVGSRDEMRNSIGPRGSSWKIAGLWLLGSAECWVKVPSRYKLYKGVDRRGPAYHDNMATWVNSRKMSK